MKDNLSEKITRPWASFREFIGNSPYLGFFRTNNLTVIVSRRPVCMPPNSYRHESVQFFIALSLAPDAPSPRWGSSADFPTPATSRVCSARKPGSLPPNTVKNPSTKRPGHPGSPPESQ